MVYEERISRELIIYSLHKELLKNKIKFAVNRKLYDLNDIEEEAQVKILDDYKYTKLDHNLILNPKYTRYEELKELVLNSDKSSFDYLLLMNSRDMSTRSINLMKDKLKKIKNNIRVLKQLGPMKIWKNELSKLDEIVNKVQTSPKRWRAWDLDYKFN
jgi:hypothetical protein